MVNDFNYIPPIKAVFISWISSLKTSIINIQFYNINRTIFLLRYKASILVFSKNYNSVNSFKSLLEKFLLIKGLYIGEKMNLYSRYASFDLIYYLNWKFKKVKNNNIFSDISNIAIHQYKSKLKILIKNSQHICLSKFLQKINILVLNFQIKNSYCSSFIKLAFQLDIYLYRLLWKWSKRKHPRRSNSWIYSKYWKSFNGIWKFCVMDLNVGNVLFLRSHILLKTHRLYKLPRAFKVFNLENYQKLNCIWFNHSQFRLNLIYRALWNKQKGVCFRCFKPLNYFKYNENRIFNTYKLLKFINNPFSELILLHKYCIF